MRTAGIALVLGITLAAHSAPVFAQQPPPDSGADHPDRFLFDFLLADVVGLSRRGDFDVYSGTGKSAKFIGTIGNLDPGTFVGGGFGWRWIFGLPSGLRFSFEPAGAWGHLMGNQLPFNAVSTAADFQLVGSLGYQHRFGRVLLHTSTMIGAEELTFSIAGSSSPMVSKSLSGSASGLPVPSDNDLSLSRWSFRLGQQAGIHVDLGAAWLYADGEYDWNNEWRVRAGFGLHFASRPKR